MARDLVLHVGTSKSGTSSLQAGLEVSVEQLHQLGVGLPFPRRPQRVRFLRALGWQVVKGFSNPVDDEQLDSVVRRLRRCPGDRLLVSIEDLAELDADRIEKLSDQIAERTQLVPRVVITCRDWSRQLPSEWQQQLKRRLTTEYPSWLDEVRAGDSAESRLFRQRQDVADIAWRWSRLVSADRIHVLPLGLPGQDLDAIFTTIAAIIGVEHGAIARPDRAINRSYGWVECEVLRRLNVALRWRLRDIAEEYNPGVRRLLNRGVLQRGKSQRVPLPPQHLAWVQAEMRRQVDALRALGVTEHGDLEKLVPDSDRAAPLPAIDEAELSRAAMDTLATFAVLSLEIRRELQARQGVSN